MDLAHSPDVNPAWRDIIVNAVFNVLGIVVVCLRLYARKLTGAGFGWDDGLVVVSVLIVNAMLVGTGWQIGIGFGRPMLEITPEGLEKLTALGRTCRFLFLFSICFVKLSALFFYLRVFGIRTGRLPTTNTTPITTTTSNANINDINNSNSNSTSSRILHHETPKKRCNFWRSLPRPSQRSVYIYLIGAVVLWTVANLVLELKRCKTDMPMCKGQKRSDLSICVFNALGDLVILALPLWPIWKLRMRTETKVGLTFVFLLGTVTIVVAFLRFGAILYTQYGGDFIESAMKAANYAILEANLANISISLPMLQPFTRRLCRYLKRRSPTTAATAASSVLNVASTSTSTSGSASNSGNVSASGNSPASSAACWWHRMFKFRTNTAGYGNMHSSGTGAGSGNASESANGNGSTNGIGSGTIDIGKSVSFKIVTSVNTCPTSTSTSPTSPTDPFSDPFRDVQERGSPTGDGGDGDGINPVGRWNETRNRGGSGKEDGKNIVARVKSFWARLTGSGSTRASDDTAEFAGSLNMGVTTTITGGRR